MFRNFHRRAPKSHRDDREARAERSVVTAITIHCLGAFRDLGDCFTVETSDVSVASIREAVSRHLVEINRSDLDGVLKHSVFAEGEELLKDHVTVSGHEVSLLPPVAGG